MRENKQLDVWLQRLSHFSQFGLFLFTIWAIYFTVIPLYQKALLDEAIAKKEVELKEAGAALERAYVRVKATILKDFVFIAGAECSGLLDLPKPSLPLLREPSSARLPFAEKLFALDVPACLTRAAEESASLKDLRPEDRKLFDQKLLTLSEELSNLRKRAMAEHNEVPKRAAANPKALPPPDGVTGQMLEFLAKRKSPEVHQRHILEATIEGEQSRIGTTYASMIRLKIATLRSIE